MTKYFIFISSFLIIVSCQKNIQIQNHIKPLDAKVFNEILDESKGSVLVVNVWATWCGPCIEEMPDLIKLADYYRDKNVKIIGISIDYIDEIESKISPFLNEQKLNFQVFVNNFENDEEFINYFNLEWSGAIPATFVYNKKGNQKSFLLGKHSFDDFNKVIENLL
jgi:thiol-disulfide isomerase/thioredoxin